MLPITSLGNASPPTLHDLLVARLAQSLTDDVLFEEPRTKSPLPSSTFQKTYRADPIAFTHDCFYWKRGDGPAFYQDEILADLVTYKREAVRGPHALGKTAAASWLVLWFALTRDGDDWKIPTTASAWRQLTKYLWPEIHKWSRRLRWDVIGRGPFDPRLELQTLSLKLATGEAFAVASDDETLIEGAHADHLLYIFDEAKSIKGELFDAAEGAFANAGEDAAGEAYAIAISTPGEPNGRFYDIHKRKPGYEDWHPKHVTLEDTILAGRVSREWAEQRRKEWGEKSAVYQNRVVGEFAASEADGIIPLAWVELANERWHAWREQEFIGEFASLGVDVARYGTDKTVFAVRKKVPPKENPEDPNPPCKEGIEELRRYSKEDTMEVAGRVKGFLDAHGGRAVIDVLNMGAGVVDRLRELGYAVLA
ncbi:MAG TPA: hypothetical protein VFD70_05640, partial [Anaerolineae bacterium]|nr:hypothetical protein [Anaerolineae bacterium]